jgi:hypothetical protein
MLLAGSVMALFAAFLWMSYTRHPHGGTGQLPVIAADKTPVKVKPDQPGGMDIPFQDTTVYDELGQGRQKGGAGATEHLLEPPEEPLPKPEAAPADATPPATPLPAAEGQTSMDQQLPAPAAPATQDTAPAAPSTDEAALAPPEPAAAATAPSTDLLLPPPPPVKPSPPAVIPRLSAPAVIKPIAAPVPVAGGGMVQLGAFRDEATANQQWIALKAAHKDELGGLSPVVERADLGDKGIWYRLKAGPLGPDEARQTCVSLKNQGATCFVAK